MAGGAEKYIIKFFFHNLNFNVISVVAFQPIIISNVNTFFSVIDMNLDCVSYFYGRRTKRLQGSEFRVPSIVRVKSEFSPSSE